MDEMSVPFPEEIIGVDYIDAWTEPHIEKVFQSIAR
jgi:hypothetical protein